MWPGPMRRPMSCFSHHVLIVSGETSARSAAAATVMAFDGTGGRTGLGALWLFVPLRQSNGESDAKEVVRLRFGRWLAVALELELGADILRTAVAPTWTEIGQLGAIAALRTALNYFLQIEIDKAELRRPGSTLEIGSTSIAREDQK
jgi:uncharacterized membrane protein